MTTIQIRRSEKPKIRRVQIMEAARKVLADQGYSAVILDDVARRARVAKGTLYLYFRDKEHLYGAVMSDLMDSFEEKLAGALAVGKMTPLEKLKTVIAESLSFFDEHQDFLMQCGQSRPGWTSERSRLQLKNRFLDHVHFLSKIIDECIRAKVLRTQDPLTGAQFMISLVRMFTARKRLFGGKALRSHTDEAVDLYLHGMGNLSKDCHI